MRDGERGARGIVGRGDDRKLVRCNCITTVQDISRFFLIEIFYFVVNCIQKVITQLQICFGIPFASIFSLFLVNDLGTRL